MQGCAGDVLVAAGNNRVLLAALTVPIVPPGLNQPGFTVTAAADVIVSEEARPWLLHLRFLQEWLIRQNAPPPGPAVAATGIVNADGSDSGLAVTNGLSVLGTNVTASGTEIAVSFQGYVQPPNAGGPQYLVKVTPWPTVAISNLGIVFNGFQNGGFVLLANKAGAALAPSELSGLKIMIEVSQYS
jgi:hypothetical protein